MIYSNQSLKEKFLYFLDRQLKDLNLVLNIIKIGDDFSSNKYVGIKQKVGQKLGVEINCYSFKNQPKNQPSLELLKDLLARTAKYQQGLIFQLPLPTMYLELVDQTPLTADVDFLGSQSQVLWKKGLLPPTVGAIDLVLKDIFWGTQGKIQPQFLDAKLSFVGKICVVIGQGVLVGSPVTKYFLDRGATLISLNKFSPQSKSLIKTGDIIITAAGQKQFLNGQDFKAGAVVVDASTSESRGQLVGDVDITNIPKEVTLCPSPKGIGPLTVRYLFWNLFRLKNLETLAKDYV